jgi:hypothetical protein
MHGKTECSSKGKCNRETGECQCFHGYEGMSCSRTLCPEKDGSLCNNHGRCVSEKILMLKANREYTEVWDAVKIVGCVCDRGYRGPDCGLIECGSGEDPKMGLGASNGRDCSGRGNCDYTTGKCQCFSSYYGSKCESFTTTY